MQLAGAVAVLLMLPTPATAVTANHKPHLVYILADDLGWANVGWNRAVPTKEVATPNLDGLVKVRALSTPLTPSSTPLTPLSTPLTP